MQCVLLIWTDIISMYQAYEVEFFLKEEEENKEKRKERKIEGNRNVNRIGRTT